MTNWNRVMTMGLSNVSLAWRPAIAGLITAAEKTNMGKLDTVWPFSVMLVAVALPMFGFERVAPSDITMLPVPVWAPELQVTDGGTQISLSMADHATVLDSGRWMRNGSCNG